MTSTALALGEQLSKLGGRLRKLLGDDDDAQRFYQIVTLQINREPKLTQCTTMSVVNAVLTAAQLRLEPGRTCHFVPFGKDCTLLIDYKGLIELAIRSGHVANVVTELAFEGEPFEVLRGTDHRIYHEPAIADRKAGKTAEGIVAAYAVAFFPSGQFDFEAMNVEQVEHVRGMSRAKNADAWGKSWGEMARKTVLRRLLKRLPQSPEMAAAIEVDDRYDLGRGTRGDPLLDTSAAAVGAQAAAQTRGKLDDLKRDLGGGDGEELPLDALGEGDAPTREPGED